MKRLHDFISSSSEYLGGNLNESPTRGARVKLGKDGEYWAYRLPDRVTSLGPVSVRSDEGSEDPFQGRVRYWGEQRKSGFGRVKTSAKIAVLAFDHTQYYTQVLLPFSSENEGLLLWIRISVPDAAFIVSQLNSELEKNTREPHTIMGRINNLISLPNGPSGIHSLVKANYRGPNDFPVIEAVWDWHTPFPGLEILLDDNFSQIVGEDGYTPLEVLQRHEYPYFNDELESLENFILKGELEEAKEHWNLHSNKWRYHHRAQHAGGVLFTKLEHHSLAGTCFHRAQILDHPDALKEEWDTHSRVTKPFRQAFPKVFQYIEHGDRLRALTILRNVAPEHPLAGNAVLSYCLRGAGEPEEGLRACNKTLQLLPDQADVLGHKWSYLTELQRDEDALQTALEHTKRYPQDTAALRNLSDSLLLLSRRTEALLIAENYAICSENIELPLDQFFKVYDEMQDWQSLLERFDFFLSLSPSPSARILALYGEALAETAQFDRAYQVFERAMAAEPGNGKVVMGYARALALAGGEKTAENLLATVLGDEYRIDHFDDRVFLITLLAEIRRRTGRPEEALATFASQGLSELVELSATVGPQPALEYIESLLELGQINLAESMVNQLKATHPEDPFVADIQQVVSAQLGSGK